MIIIPAIDLLQGKCVMLLQGMERTETVYSDNPVEVAQKWESTGAELVHVVDLDGAFTGNLANFDIVKNIAQSIRIPIQLGGGIRREEAVQEIIDSGISRVILGTKACEKDFLKNVLRKHSEKIIVGIDAREGIVTVKGWKEYTDLEAAEFAKEAEDLGVKTIIFTDISVNGTLEGPCYGSIENLLKAVSIDVIASGGIHSIYDIKKLKQYEKDGLVGAIIGKALYTGDIDLKQAIKVSK